MAQLRTLRTHRLAVAAMLAGPPLAAHAEAAFGPPDPLLGLLIGLVVGIAPGIACVLVEVIVPRRRVPGPVVLAAVLASIVVVWLLYSATKAPLGSAARFAPGFWIALPALMLLALRGAVPNTWARIGAGWVLAATLLALVHPGGLDNVRLSFFIGATLTCLGLWSIALVVLGLTGIRASEPAGSRRGTFALSPQLRDAARNLGCALMRELREFGELLGPARAGLVWWLGSATLIYLGIGVLIGIGALDAFWIYAAAGRVVEFFGRRMPNIPTALGAWWLLGLPWSLLAGGAVWGMAAQFGAVDPGRMRGLRLASILVGGGVILWSASIFVQTHAVEAAERAAVTGHR